jgi:hypothetical protein
MSSKNCDQKFAIVIHSDECFLHDARDFTKVFVRPSSPSPSHSLSHSLQNGSSPVLRSVRKLRRFGPSSGSVREIEKLRKNRPRKIHKILRYQNLKVVCISLRFLLLEFGHATLFQCKGFNAAVVFFCHSNCGERELLQVSCMIETVST